MRTYHLTRAQEAPALSADWRNPAWRDVPELLIDQFHPNSMTQLPRTRAKLLLANQALHALFLVDDLCVRSVATHYQDPVSRDSCVELFLSPKPGCGYFNFEWNCGGVMLLFHVVDPTQENGVFRNYRPVLAEYASLIDVVTTMPRTTPIEISGAVQWGLHARIPMSVMEVYVGEISTEPGTCWAANLYKCASETSCPHWASWCEIGPTLNFHQPSHFGRLLL